MDHIVEAFSSLWELKFPGAQVPTPDFFESIPKLEEGIVKTTEKIDQLRLELRKQEFLLEYLRQAKKKSCGVVNGDKEKTSVDTGNIVTATDLDVDDTVIDSSEPGIYSSPPDRNNQRTLTGTQSASMDSGISTGSKTKTSLTRGQSCGNPGLQLNYDTESDSDSDSHEYMVPGDYAIKPLPKLPQQQQTMLAPQFSDDADVYQNLHMKPTLEKLKDSSDSDDSEIYSVPNTPAPTPVSKTAPRRDEDIYSVPSITPDRRVKRLGSSDRKATTFSEDLDVMAPIGEGGKPKIVIDQNVSSSQDDEDSHIYANIKDVVPLTRMSDTDDSDNDVLHGTACVEPHYREMTPSEIERLRCCDDERQVYDSDDPDGGSGRNTPDIHRRKISNESSTDVPRLRSEQHVCKRPDNKEKDAGNLEQTEEEKLKTSSRNRKFLAMNLLDSEKMYIDCLDILAKYMKPLRVSTESSQPILSGSDFQAIFHGADAFVPLHKDFMTSLEPLVQDWNETKCIGEAFKPIMEKFDQYSSYISNYKHSLETVQKCRNANKQFQEIMEQDIRIPSLKEPLKIDGLLYKPIDRMTQYSLILNDLLKHTLPEHPDHHYIAEITGGLVNLFEEVNVDTSKKARQQRTFLKETAVVELVDGERRARNLILFNDVLISAKLRSSRDSYICKWYAALQDISLKPYPNNSQDTPVVPTSKSECDKLRASIANLKQELRKEMPTVQQVAAGDAASPFIKRHASRQHGGHRASSRAIEKLKKKIEEQDQLLQLLTPSTPIYIYTITGKTYTLLVGTDADKQAWHEALKPRISKAVKRKDGPVQLSSLELQKAFETVVKMQALQFDNKNKEMVFPVQSAGRPISMDIASMEEYKHLLSGYLYAKINNAKGFHKNSETYIVLETCSYGHFYRKGKTKPVRGSDPQWDQEFNLEIEACQYLRLTCYNKLRLIGDDVSGKASIDLPREGLNDNQVHSITVSMDKGVVTMNLSLSFSTTSEGIIKNPSTRQEGVFGVPIKTVCKRECSDIPAVVISCIKEIEKRGMDEVGIYRLSGVAREIRDLKKLFDEDTQMAVLRLADVDVHAVAGLMKLYFRELPESLFTNKLYNRFVQGLSITDPEEKELYMADVLHELPKANLMTTLYLFHHLRRVILEEDANKMTLNNLSTVFGPTVLRPPPSGDSSDSCNVGSFDIGALDVMSQVGVFRYILSLQNNERTKLPEDDLELWRRLDAEKAKQIEMGSYAEFLI